MKIVGKMVRQLLTSFVHKPATVRYPAVKVTMPPKFRGKLAYFPEKCIGCKLCMRDCPTGAISIRKVGDKQFEADIDLSKCIYCAQCVDTCPKKALEATGAFELAQLERAKLRITYRAEPKDTPPEPTSDVKPHDGPAKTA
jgi:formate hydrogenlyase subunit 6/NADH:ubiquinone oxidoreductase subunit I